MPAKAQFGHRDLWDTRHLKARLAARQVPEWLSFAYFLLVTLFDWLQFAAARLLPAPLPLPVWEVAGTLCALALSAGGLLFLFYCNARGDGQDFLQRYFALSFVVGWKFAVASLLLSGLLPLAASGVTPAVQGWGGCILLASLNVGMFRCMGQHLCELAAARPVLH